MKELSEMNYSEFCEFIDSIANDFVESVICTDDFTIYHDKKNDKYFYLEYVEEGGADEFYELEVVATLKYHLRYDSDFNDFEHLFESDCGGFVYDGNNHIQYYWFKKKIYFEWADIIKLPDGQIVAERHPISGIMDADGIYQIDDFYCAVAAKYGIDSDDIKTYMMDNIDFNPKETSWGAAECGCYVDGIPEESLEEWGFDGTGWTCSRCGGYAPGHNHSSDKKPDYSLCPHCKSRMNVW